MGLIDRVAVGATFCRRALLLTIAVALAGCAGRAAPPTPEPPAPGTPGAAGGPPPVPDLPPIPPRTGALALDLVYPPEDATVGTDSTFVFGSTGTGAATLTINGTSVPVAPNGAFLAFLPVPSDGVYRLQAQAEGATDTLVREVSVPVPAEVVAGGIVPGSLEPRGVHVVRRGELVTVRFRAPPGGRARLILPDGRIVPMVERAVEQGPATGFMQRESPQARETEYAVSVALDAPVVAADTSIARPTLTDLVGAPAFVDLVTVVDSVRVPLPTSIGVLEFEDVRVGEAVEEGLSGVVWGMAAAPPGTPYHWAFPTGTRLPLTGERPGAYRVGLTDDLSVWVPASRVRLLPRGSGDVQGSVGTVRVTPHHGYDEVRIATSDRFPFHVDAGDRSLVVSVYGARSRTNWMYLPTDGSLIEGMQWSQASGDEWRLEIQLAQRLWGWKTEWAENGDLLLRVRRPPQIDAANPLRGIVVAVDAGHPPGGAIGPTRFTEAEANLEIVKRLIPLLRDAGATVVETRPDTAALGLYERVVAAEQGGADVFVSVHNNAFGDGVNPFENAGTSVLYNRPQALPLSRQLQRQLLGELGLRDLGVIRADIAVIRHNTWMPAALTETMFLMLPRQEAALRNPGVQERIARAHVRGLEAFLRERAERP